MKRALGLYAAALYAFLHLPLVILAAFSFNASRFTVWEGFSLDWYRAVLRDPNLAEAALNSVEIALVSTILSTVIGTACAYGFWKRRDVGGQRLPSTAFQDQGRPATSKLGGSDEVKSRFSVHPVYPGSAPLLRRLFKHRKRSPATKGENRGPSNAAIRRGQ